LQLDSPDADENRRIAAEWEAWCAAIGFAERLRTMKKSRTVDGEVFALLTTNPRLASPVQLDVKLIEADQVETPGLFFPTALISDGIIFDTHGNPTEYHVLKSHPGDQIWTSAPWEYVSVPADLVIHWFRVDRPGQVRGVPDITPAIELFGQLRRYTAAVIAAAETAADFAAVL
jgi:capsid protein